jgi:hypothetical protein
MTSVFGERDVWIVLLDKNEETDRVLAKLDHQLAAFAAYKVYVERNPGEKIIVKYGARVIRKSWEE